MTSTRSSKRQVKKEEAGQPEENQSMPEGDSVQVKPSSDASIHGGVQTTPRRRSKRAASATSPPPAAAAVASTTQRRTRSSASAKRVKREEEEDGAGCHRGESNGVVKEEEEHDEYHQDDVKLSSGNGQKEQEGKTPPSESLAKSVSATPSPSKSTLAKKLKQLEAYLQTPFPDWKYPTHEQCQTVQDALSRVHGLPKRPAKLVDRAGAPAGCGAVPDVLDALVRTILSQNTTSANSTRAKEAMDERYGRANYVAVHRASVEDLADTIKHGGLANNKSKSIKAVLSSLVQKQLASGTIESEDDLKHISLDYLHDLDDLEAMKELVSFDGVGPKTASCVLLFCLGRNSFAVDTHVFRITKALGWTPPKANRETAFQHLDVRIPSENKYPLHSLFVRHGRSCRLCSANGNITEKEVDPEQCPIKAILKQQRQRATGRADSASPTKKRGTATAKKAGAEKEEEGEDEDITMPGEIPDKEEDQGKPNIGIGEDEVGPEVVWEGQIKP